MGKLFDGWSLHIPVSFVRKIGTANHRREEVKMKSKICFAVLSTIFLVCGNNLTGFCRDVTNAQRLLMYSACIDDCIFKCEAKAKLLARPSLNIRKDALRAIIKGAYYRCNRNELIKYLMEQNVPLNHHRIKYHLNQKFIESVHPYEVYKVLLIKHDIK